MIAIQRMLWWKITYWRHINKLLIIDRTLLSEVFLYITRTCSSDKKCIPLCNVNTLIPHYACCRCFVGDDVEMMVEDCILRDRKNPIHDPRETSRSVSEMKEWTCAKMTKPDGRVIRDCMKLYTGGEHFHICYSSTKDGDTCLCSRELCNGGTSFVTRKFKTLTCQNIIKSSSSLISCIFLIMMFRNYCQTVMTGQAYYLNNMNVTSREQLGRRISWQTSI